MLQNWKLTQGWRIAIKQQKKYSCELDTFFKWWRSIALHHYHSTMDLNNPRSTIQSSAGNVPLCCCIVDKNASFLCCSLLLSGLPNRIVIFINGRSPSTSCLKTRWTSFIFFLVFILFLLNFLRLTFQLFWVLKLLILSCDWSNFRPVRFGKLSLHFRESTMRVPRDQNDFSFSH